MPLTMEEGRRSILTTRLQGFYLEEFDEEISTFRAEAILDFFLTALGPQVYNQAVQDARRFIQERLEDMDGEVYQPEGV